MSGLGTIAAHDPTDVEIDRSCRTAVEAWGTEERARKAKEEREAKIEAERAAYLRQRAHDGRIIK